MTVLFDRDRGSVYENYFYKNRIITNVFLVTNLLLKLKKENMVPKSHYLFCTLDLQEVLYTYYTYVLRLSMKRLVISFNLFL